MFGSRWLLLEVFASIRALATAQEKVIALEAENARLRASCDWLADQVNQLNQERQVYIAQLFHVQIPVPVVEAPPSPGQARDELRRNRRAEDLTPEKLRSMADRFAPPAVRPAPGAEGARGRVFTPGLDDDTTNLNAADAQAAMAIFEDMGDDAAARAGVK